MAKYLIALALVFPLAAEAFCGFYVSSAGAEMFNDATMVVLMRDGTRTVLSMQNNYRGPTDDFALVVPVPVVLKKENVKTLPREVFSRIDTIASPRLVEEFESGQCPPPPPMALAGSGGCPNCGGGMPRDLGVKVEARFEVAEYEIVVLSAKDSMGLEIWLKENKYKIPAGAEPLLKPYVAANWKFFVARVNAKKVTFQDGQALLSPLRFHYDAEAFALPVRLGLANSSGLQDLIVHVIAKGRYELANVKNVTVPSNLRLKPSAQSEFGAFYADLLDRTFKAHPGAAVTELAWEGALPPPKSMQQQGIYGVTCDPCPPPIPIDDPLAKYLGADVMPGLKTDEDIAKFAQAATITRLHLRYTKESLTDDLVFKKAEPIAGGIPEQEKTGPARANRFQGRYIIKKPFDPSRCWSGGGMARGGAQFAPGPMGTLGATGPTVPSGLTPAKPTVGPPPAPKKLTLAFEDYLAGDVAELGLKAKAPAPQPPTAPKK